VEDFVTDRTGRISSQDRGELSSESAPRPCRFNSMRLLQPSELVDPPPSPTFRALAMGRLILYGQQTKFVLDWLKREPTLIHERCPITGLTPLHAVVLSSTMSQADKLPVIQWLLQNGADFGTVGWLGKCALHIVYPDTVMTTLLLELGARPIPYTVDGSRITLLSVAASKGQIEMLRLLLEWHAKADLFTAAELDQALGYAQRQKQDTAAELLTGAKSGPPVQSQPKPHVQSADEKPDAPTQSVKKVRPQVPRDGLHDRYTCPDPDLYLCAWLVGDQWRIKRRHPFHNRFA
jgi:hypothetical protein